MDVSVGSWVLDDPAEIDEFFGSRHSFPGSIGRYRLGTEFVHTPNLSVEWFSHQGDVIIEDATPGRQLFGIFGDRGGELIAGGTPARRCSVVAANPDPRVYRLRDRNDYVVVSVPELWIDVGDLALLDIGVTSARFSSLSSSLAHLRWLSHVEGVSPEALVVASERVADALFAVAADARPVSGRFDLDVADAIVVEAVTAIRDERASSVAELTRQVSASRSSLYRSFHAVLGISPYTYMQQRRLLQLRRRLLQVDSEPGVVTREAANVGAFHLGNLAGSYRKLFGECPSDTAKRRSSMSHDELDDVFGLPTAGGGSWAV